MSVAPEVLTAVVPVLSMQPLVENAVRHGVESAPGPCRVEILGADLDADVELTVSDGGAGMSAEDAARGAGRPRRGHRARQRPRAAAVDVRRRSTGWRSSPRPARAPACVMRVPKFRARGARRRERLRVLAVDDERPALDDLARVLRAQPRRRRGGHRGVAARRRCTRSRGEHYDAVFLDVRMPGLDGVELARVLRRFASAAGADLRLRLRVGRGRGVRAARARLPAQAGVAARGWRRRSRGSRPSRPTERAGHARRSTRRGGGTRLRPPRRRALPAGRTATTCAWSPATAASCCAARWARSSAAGSRTASTACTARFLVNLRRAVEVRPQLNGTALLILADGAELPIARREVAELRRRLRA